MPESYYIIPMVAPPYSRENPQRPQFVDEIQCNWTGHNVDSLGVYICKVNTTEAKHTDLAGRAGVRQLPRQYTWDTVISTMQAAARNFIRNWMTDAGLVYDSSETLGQALMRIINSGLFDIVGVNPNSAFSTLNAGQQQKIVNLCQKWGLTAPTASETVKQISSRMGNVYWHGPSLTVPEY